MNNFHFADARWASIMVMLVGTLAVSALAVRQAKAGSTLRVREATALCRISMTWGRDRNFFEAKVMNVADNHEKSSEWLKRLFALYKDEDKEDSKEDSVRVEAMSRDSRSKSLAIPLLAASMRQSVVAGTRPFHIAWVGGKPPFAVELIGPSGAPVASWPQTAEHSVAATVSLEEGFYELHVTDASGQPVFGAFEATPQPPAVDRRDVEQLPPDLGAALLAARLADMDDGAWQLEAYERLTAESSSDATRIVANRLAHGLSVSELRVQGAQLR